MHSFQLRCPLLFWTQLNSNETENDEKKYFFTTLQMFLQLISPELKNKKKKKKIQYFYWMFLFLSTISNEIV